MKATSGESEDELFSWGSTKSGILGHGEPKSEIVNKPTRIEFGEKSTDKPLKVSMISVGADHAALITSSHNLYSWGANKMGQLGLGDTIDRPQATLNTVVSD